MESESLKKFIHFISGCLVFLVGETRIFQAWVWTEGRYQERCPWGCVHDGHPTAKCDGKTSPGPRPDQQRGGRHHPVEQNAREGHPLGPWQWSRGNCHSGKNRNRTVQSISFILIPYNYLAPGGRREETCTRPGSESTWPRQGKISGQSFRVERGVRQCYLRSATEARKL